MLDLKVDLGQIVIVTFISVIGWFVKREITLTHERINGIEKDVEQKFNDVGDKFDKQNEVIFGIAGNVQKLIGMLQPFGRNKS